eukprot:28224-Chlamydomonas_euryale.AAC.10
MGSWQEPPACCLFAPRSRLSFFAWAVPLPYKVLVPCPQRERALTLRRPTPHASSFPWMFGPARCCEPQHAV